MNISARDESLSLMQLHPAATDVSVLNAMKQWSKKKSKAHPINVSILRIP